MSFKPREYQVNDTNSILNAFNNYRKVLYSLPTGAGKTFAFTMITKHFTKTLNKKVLVLCHRKELVEQTIDSFARVGVTSEAIYPKVKRPHHKSDSYVAMIETAYNRLNDDPNFFKDVGLIICDECHILVFNKVFDFFPESKILGCTATPVLTQRLTYFKCNYCNREYSELKECCNTELMEWSKPLTMSHFYDTIVVGPSIKYLIDNGYLVKETSFIKKYIDENTLKVGSDGDYTKKSQEDAYNKDDVMFNVVLNYKELCFGKKTMIFTASTKTNLMLVDEFKKQGIENVRSFDSRNDKSTSRKELVKWFKDSSDGILINTGVFTTGFDDTTVQAIIMARSSLSLSLYLQIVGRGGRVTDKIFKDTFIFIDGGGNIERHLEWSDPSRDWEHIFYKGIGEDKPKKQALDQITDCENCGMLYSKNTKICPECGHERYTPPPTENVEILSDEILMPIREIPPPNGEILYKFTKSQNENINFAFKIMINRIDEMFVMYRVSKEKYLRSVNSGELDRKVKKMIQKCYFILVKKEDIIPENWQGRTIDTLVERVKEKLKKRYNIL